MKLLIATIIGYLGTACLVLSFQCKRESRLFLCMLVSGFFSIFPMIALLVSTWFIFGGKGDNIKKAQLFCTSPSWMVYNIYVRSMPGIICEALDMISVIVYFVRTRKRK